MIDQAKRRSLKLIAVATGAGASLVSTGAKAACGLFGDPLSENETVVRELANLRVTTGFSVVRNDLEIVLTNTGNEPITITHMTPHRTVVPRGEFDFSALLKNGPLTLASGENVAVPLRHAAVSISTGNNIAGDSMIDSLKKSLSIVTDGDSFAAVTVVDAAAVA